MKLKTMTIRVAVSLAVWLLCQQLGWSFYNPHTGRRLTRDPLESAGTDNLYAFVKNRPTCLIDPNGRLHLELVSANTNFVCGGARVQWDFWLDFTYDMNGWIVQEVDYSFQYARCGLELPPPINQTYYEAWPVPATANRPERSGVGYDDLFSIVSHRGTAGWQSMRGRAKFYLENITGDLNDAANGFYGPTEGGHVPGSGDLRSTYARPDWWFMAGDEWPAAYHELSASWSCGCCTGLFCNDWNSFSYSPQ